MLLKGDLDGALKKFEDMTNEDLKDFRPYLCKVSPPSSLLFFSYKILHVKEMEKLWISPSLLQNTMIQLI